jgi:hypothetical protein
VARTVGVIRGIRPFDPSHFLADDNVSLQAIFLALFVLAGQNRFARNPTNAVISICRSICPSNKRDDCCAPTAEGHPGHFDVQTISTPEQLRELMKKTEVRGSRTER